VSFDRVENSGPAPGFDNCVFKGSGLDDLADSGGVGVTATMAAPQASHFVAPALKFLPQFVQNVMNFVLCSVQKIPSLRPGALEIWRWSRVKPCVV
jgi:hypothetical protein